MLKPILDRTKVKNCFKVCNLKKEFEKECTLNLCIKKTMFDNKAFSTLIFLLKNYILFKNEKFMT